MLVEKIEFEFKVCPPEALKGVYESFRQDGLDFCLNEGIAIATAKNQKIDSCLRESVKAIEDKAKDILESALFLYTLGTSQTFTLEIDQIRFFHAENKSIVKPALMDGLSVSDEIELRPRIKGLKMVSGNACLVLSPRKEKLKNSISGRQQIYADSALKRALEFYQKALENKKEALYYLYKSLDYIESTGKKYQCGISKKEISKATKLMNQEPLLESRHAKKISLRSISKEELDYCFEIIKELIEGYLKLN